MTGKQTCDSPFTYEIRVQGRLDASWADWFDGFTITAQNGETILLGQVADQSALQGLLARISRLNLPLISIRRIDDGQE